MQIIIERRGTLALWGQEGGFASDAIEIDGKALDRIIAEALGERVISRGGADLNRVVGECSLRLVLETGENA